MDFMLEEEMIDLLTFCLQNPDSDEIESKNLDSYKLEKKSLIMEELTQWKTSFLQ